MNESLPFLSASEIACRVRGRELTSLEVVQACIERIITLNKSINAIIHLDPDRALTQARAVDSALALGKQMGRLCGVPITIKDLFEVTDMPATSGTLGRRSFVPSRDATLVGRLRAAGCVVIGKSNVPEFGAGLETTNLIAGTTSNPYDCARTSGGSSGGAAAAVAAGFSALDIGSDGGGSIRLPAHFCGVAALKATSNTLSKAGHFPLQTGTAARMAGFGPFARSVEDLAVAFEVMVGEDSLDPDALPAVAVAEHAFSPLRVALFTDNGVLAPTSDTVTAIERCAAAFEAVGAIVTRVCPPNLPQAFEIHLGLLIADRVRLVESQQVAGTETLHPSVAAGIRYLEEAAADFDSTTATLLCDDWYTFRTSMSEFMRNFDLIIGPVTTEPAPLHGVLSQGSSFEATSYACVHNLTGYPTVVVRCGLSNGGLPIGVELAAKPFRERLLFDAARIVEAKCGGFKPPPRMS